MLLVVPKVRLEIAKQNFVFQACCIWNELIPKLMNKCSPNLLGIMVPGSSQNSDLSTSISTIKKKLRGVLLDIQKIDSLMNPHERSISDDWESENFFNAHYTA